MRLFKTLSFVFILGILFAGCDSDDEVVFTQVGITKLSINSFPSRNTSNDDWDSSLAGVFPDVFFNITESGNLTSLYQLPVSQRIENLRNSDLPTFWSTSNGSAFYQHTNLSQPIDINLYDYDTTSSDDYIGSITINFQNHSSYPQIITKSVGNISITLELSWGT